MWKGNRYHVEFVQTAAYYKQTRASLQHLVHTMHDCKGGNYHLNEENEIRRVVQKCQENRLQKYCSPRFQPIQIDTF